MGLLADFNGYVLILIIAAIVGGILFLGWSLCCAADDDWHLERDEYEETPLWRQKR